MSEYPESEFGNSFANNIHYRNDVTKQLEESEAKRHKIEVKMIELEEEKA